MTPGTATGDPPFRRELSNHPQTLRGPFSAVSTAPIATKYSFFQDFRDLQDFHTFAPLRSQNFSKKVVTILSFSEHFREIPAKIHQIFAEKTRKVIENTR